MKRRMREFLSFRCNDRTREAIQQLADTEEVAMAEVARDLLNEGLRARGIEV